MYSLESIENMAWSIENVYSLENICGVTVYQCLELLLKTFWSMGNILLCYKTFWSYLEFWNWVKKHLGLLGQWETSYCV